MNMPTLVGSAPLRFHFLFLSFCCYLPHSLVNFSHLQRLRCSTLTHPLTAHTLSMGTKMLIGSSDCGIIDKQITIICCIMIMIHLSTGIITVRPPVDERDYIKLKIQQHRQQLHKKGSLNGYLQHLMKW
ncbi:hypothetical protein GOODEAATRI_015631 [Goodea atripinnis]|uniref:Uncharacterized protein n=1 Tax=Goodea atripinnis TaxID=208336 RepID=A0ABV0MSB9_9TELE